MKKQTLFILVYFFVVATAAAQTVIAAKEPSLQSKIRGMLTGSAIGDAAGGPVEFVHPPGRIWG